jgi:hypothetical protein
MAICEGMDQVFQIYIYINLHEPNVNVKNFIKKQKTKQENKDGIISGESSHNPLSLSQV